MLHHMSVERWADITEAGASSDGERGSGGRGGERATRTERAAQRLVHEVVAVPLPPGRVCVAEGGIAGGEPEAGSMLAAANFAGFATLLDAYLESAIEVPYCHRGQHLIVHISTNDLHC